MSTFVTPAEAKHLKCPFARTFGEDNTSGCRGYECAFWRWKPMMASDPMFTSAVKREMTVLQNDHKERTGKERGVESFHGEAVKRVMADIEAHGIKRTRGYCGAAGLPT